MSSFHGAVNDRIIQRLFPSMLEEEREQLSKRKEAMYRELCREDVQGYQLVAGLQAFLDTAKQKGIEMNIASASIQENIAFFIETFHLSTWFTTKHVCFDDGRYTDKVKMFQAAANHMQVKMNECIVFEDSLSGIACAKEAGAYKIVAIAPIDQQDRFVGIEGIDLMIENYHDERIWKLWKTDK